LAVRADTWRRIKALGECPTAVAGIATSLCHERRIPAHEQLAGKVEAAPTRRIALVGRAELTTTAARRVRA
jgi:hypothetical protein